jgi:hypothetical protein
MTLAYLNDRIRRPDGSYAPWRSPAGVGLSIGASAPVIPWSDLSAALVPNGRFRDTFVPKPTTSRSPAGVPLKAFTDLLYAAALGSGFVAPAGANPAADLTGWKARLDRGEPYTADVGVILREIFDHHSALGVTGRTPAPLHIAQGWTDELFPVDQALRAYNDLREGNDDAEVTLDLGDFGHPRASNPEGVVRARNARIASFLDARLKPGTGPAPRPRAPWIGHGDADRLPGRGGPDGGAGELLRAAASRPADVHGGPPDAGSFARAVAARRPAGRSRPSAERPRAPAPRSPTRGVKPGPRSTCSRSDGR